MTVTDDMVERAAFAVERACNPHWTDEEFEIWWNRDPWFVTKIKGWGFFRGTEKERRLWEARIALTAALG